MDRQKIAKHVIESSKTSIDDSATSITSFYSDSAKQFFRFVDKNPFFEDNSTKCINKFLLASRKKRHIASSSGDENHERFSAYLSGPDIHKRDK
jgi:hypothetical protein